MKGLHRGTELKDSNSFMCKPRQKGRNLLQTHTYSVMLLIEAQALAETPDARARLEGLCQNGHRHLRGAYTAHTHRESRDKQTARWVAYQPFPHIQTVQMRVQT